ncbi:hypothetical protein SAMN04488057_105113 [Cyclobacterium lianum]|uniref:Uncharacterized protein n=1 Tax=Cyclobacterium lianum TaxID=388280 RepID=A0A1M7N7N1_9BACT|nr:hypothetical protein [Cyclobacterium lianum]SHM99565.1 hypothetical protein SAMN04488057_105113 [Cyclobacterium lianum]
MIKLLLLSGTLWICLNFASAQSLLGFKVVPGNLGQSNLPPVGSNYTAIGKAPFLAYADISEIQQSFSYKPRALTNKIEKSGHRHRGDNAIAEQYNMPIIDLSKGFSSDLPIKKFPEDFPSRMPIIPGKGPKSEMFPEGLNNGGVPIVVPESRRP